MTIARRGFLGTALGFGSDVAFNDGKATKSLLEKLADVGSAEASQHNRGIESLTQDDVIYDINRALQKVKWGRSQKGYEDAFAHFSSIYDISMARYHQTKDEFFLRAAVVSAMYAGKSMLDASSLNNGKKMENLRNALFSYGNTLATRQKLGTGKHDLYKKGIIDQPVADEKLIRKRTAEAYEELIRITSGREKENYLRSLIATYKRLTQLTDGTEKFNYQIRIQDVSAQLGKIK